MHKLVHFNCADKTLKESWHDMEKKSNLANFPSPFRLLAIGPPNTGKSTLFKNLVIHQRPYFDEVYVCHADCELTREYDDLEPDAMFSDIPNLEWFDSLEEYKPSETEVDTNGDPKEIRIKRLLIIDDIEFTKCSKQRLQNIALLFRYVSSHKAISVMLGHQSFFDLPPLVKKMSDLFIIWRPRSRNELTLIENRAGLDKGQLLELFNKHCPDPRDSICIDHIRNSPSPLRLNIWTPITL